ncbi:E3 ubiquitin-protein ligase XB3 [Iris pallida]|uniref:E3 ubiquitin-protein ligase XB3 n=1 Tax=Iris pallida TaxID=29817 RepID=A0AAX6FSE9_IRIPA|nr:E3 ubiquitin-protein ligase XB3 [Iris pallida]
MLLFQGRGAPAILRLRPRAIGSSRPMGQGLSCVGPSREVGFFHAAQSDDADAVGSTLRWDPTVLDWTTVYDHLSALHIAAANGRLEVLSMLLDRVVHPDLLNRHRQTPLMLAAMHGKIAYVQKLL